MKLAVVGGGSTYTPEVIDGLVQFRNELPVDDLYLHDTNDQRLQIVAGFAKRMLARAGHPANLVATTSLDDAVEGADAVLIQIRVGGQSARMVDESVPLACGCIGQETTGYGGVAEGPPPGPGVLPTAPRARRRPPEAGVRDFPEPVGSSTE